MTELLEPAIALALLQLDSAIAVREYVNSIVVWITKDLEDFLLLYHRNLAHEYKSWLF